MKGQTIGAVSISPHSPWTHAGVSVRALRYLPRPRSAGTARNFAAHGAEDRSATTFFDLQSVQVLKGAITIPLAA